PGRNGSRDPAGIRHLRSRTLIRRALWLMAGTVACPTLAGTAARPTHGEDPINIGAGTLARPTAGYACGLNRRRVGHCADPN
ncbi:MAG TPA: hypothetical protein VKN73_00100, partial [Desulfosalsimonadaceae bacterium]|nr:hypothetical protein [Desulfosalsimonadaceae bacterium]